MSSILSHVQIREVFKYSAFFFLNKVEMEFLVFFLYFCHVIYLIKYGILHKNPMTICLSYEKLLRWI